MDPTSIESFNLFPFIYHIPCLIHEKDIHAASTAAEKTTICQSSNTCGLKIEDLRMPKMFHQNVCANKLRNQVLIIGRFRY